MYGFQKYGKLAEENVADIIQNGRYYAQRDAEKLIPGDVFSKLKVKASDSFLDVGCGVGINLQHALKLTEDCAACDHEKVIEKIEQNELFSNVKFYSGDFLDIEFDQKFSKILIYGVVPVLPNEDVLYAFLEKALSTLAEEGALLIGDFPNIDKKQRFLNSQRGQEFQKEWEKKLAEMDTGNNDSTQYHDERFDSVLINDQVMMDVMRFFRTQGYHAYLLGQPQNLPFGNTREDLLILGPEYKDN